MKCISYIYNPCAFTMHFSQFGCFFPHLKVVTEAGFLFPVYCFRSYPKLNLENFQLKTALKNALILFGIECTSGIV